MTLTLSNGTQIEQVRMPDHIKAIVLPDDREMTDEEWAEYVLIVRKQARKSTNLGQSSRESNVPAHKATVLP